MPLQNLRILIVDDFEPIRALLRTLLQEASGFEIIGEASDGFLEAIEMTRKLLPDAISSWMPEMPGISGIETTRTIHSEFPHIKVIGLSIHDEIDMRDGMLQAGAIRYFSKNQPWDETIALIGQILIPAEGSR